MVFFTAFLGYQRDGELGGGFLGAEAPTAGLRGGGTATDAGALAGRTTVGGALGGTPAGFAAVVGATGVATAGPLGPI